MSDPKPPGQRWTPNPDPTSIIVPGVEASASINDQIDQIDQLITIRLQNIDANFSRIQHLIANKLLPAFKRYAESTEPVREAAKFWKSFYEAAAQTRIPVAPDTSSFYHTEGDSGDNDTTGDSEQEPNRTPINTNIQEDSFLRGAPVSSTPLTRDPTTVNLPGDDEDDDSWTASIESPFERLGRQVRDLTLEENKEDDPSTSSAPSFSPLHGSYTGALPGQQPHTYNPNKEEVLREYKSEKALSNRKGKSPLRQNVLRQNAALAAASEGTSTPAPSLHTPRRGKTPKNPFLPPNSGTQKWNGLVDLRQPSPARSRGPHTLQPSSSKHGDGYDSDSSDDLFPPGMSPPVTMQFAMASRARATPAKLTLTPARKAAERIGRDLVAGAAERGTGAAKRLRSPLKPMSAGEPSISSVAPSLPSLTRYSGRSKQTSPWPIAATIEPPPPQSGYMTPAHQIYRSRMGPGALTQTSDDISDQATIQQGRPYVAPDPRLLIVDEAAAPSPGSDSDSSEHDESNPSAGFLFATQNNARAPADDSFASSQQSMSSDEDEDDAARAARHPLAHIFATGPQEVEDSFDQDDSFAQGDDETVFGARQVGQGGGGRLTLMRDALIDETDTRAVSLNPFAQVEQSPTPYVGNVEDLHVQKTKHT